MTYQWRDSARHIGVVAPMTVEFDAICKELLERGASHKPMAASPRDALNDVAGVGAHSVESLRFRQYDITLSSSGIGKVNAAIACTRLVLEHGVDCLGVLGTAGLLGELESGAWLVDSAFQHDYGAADGNGITTYTVGDVPIGPARVSISESSVARELLAAGTGLRHARVASGDVFLQDAGRGRQLNDEFGADLIDMETAAVAQVAEHFGIPWLAVRAISDDANDHSADDILANMQRASTEAAILFCELLSGNSH